MHKQLVTFNAGSSTVKIGTFTFDGQQIRKLARGEIDLNESPVTFRLRGESGNLDIALASADAGNIVSILEELFARLSDHISPGNILGVGHRVVFGGDHFPGRYC